VKKFLILILLFLIISIPNLVNAQGIVKGNGDIVIKSNEEVRGDVRLGNGNVTVYGKYLET